MLREFIQDDYVLYASPNGIATLDWHPNDPEFEGSEGIQWNLLNRGDENGYPGSIGAKSAWDYQKGNKDVIVAVVDTGVNIGHEDLGWREEGPIWINDDAPDGLDNDGNGFPDDTHGWNFFDNDDNLTDDIGHGTQVAGIIGARTNNGKGIAAVCPNVTIMPVKVYGREERDTNDATIANGIDYAVKNGADIINLSLAGSNPDNLAYTCEAVQRAYDNVCVVVASSGNDDKDFIYCPADRPGTIAVGASDFFSGRCHDMPWGSNYGAGLDLMAPGTGVKSTGPGGGYEPLEGTSAAAPHVSGVAALILSQEIPYAKDRVKHYLNKTAYKNPDPEEYNSWECGNGLLDAEKALDTVVNPPAFASSPDYKAQCEWYFPEGSTAWGYEEWICVQNPNAGAAKICLELMTPDSSTFDQVRTVPANSRTSIRINDILTSDVSVRLMSDSKVYAERSLYWSDRREGHTCHGLKHDPLEPNSTWYLAEGCTGTPNAESRTCS